jgi:outer membrane protein assembly factor BamB
VLKVDLAGRLADSFSPASWPSDNDSDLDLGSQAPAIVAGTWVYADGKSGAAYVLALDHLGGIGGQVSQATVCRSFGGTAVVGSTVYVPCSDSGDAAVRISSGGKLSVLWRAAGSIHGSPVIGGGRVWALDQQGGVLFALDPATGKIREQIDVGATSRFATPALSGNRVLVGTLTGLTVVTTS